MYLNTYTNVLLVGHSKEHPLNLWTQGKNVRLCIYSVLATNIVFGKPRRGGKAREIGHKIQKVARSTILEETSKSLREGKDLD